MNKIQSIFRLKTNHFSTYSQNSKLQIFNNNFDFLCGDIVMSLTLMGPSHKLMDNSTVTLKTFRGLTMRCVHQKEMYTRGSIRIAQAFSLNNIKDLLSFKFQLGKEYLAQNEQQKITIQLNDKPKLSGPNKSLKGEDLLVKMNSQNGTMKFFMKMEDMQKIKRTLKLALPELYGINTSMEFGLKNLLFMKREGLLDIEQEKEQEDIETNFKL